MPRRRLSPWTLVLLVAVVGVLWSVQPRPAASPAADAAPPPAFTLPPGFTIEKIAAAPLVEHPVFACFDDRGRLYVAENAGQNLRADDLLKVLPNLIKRLEDTDGDGVFDKAITFADKMSFPMGVLWHDGAVYTCSPPSLWKLEDTNGDGVADKRTELVTKFGFTGNAADIHGPFLGPDGLLYWCDGRHGHEISRPDGTVMKGKAARIFRCRLDGTGVETVCGGGMDNPVEVAFTEEGEPFCTANIVVGQPRQDGILYCIEGGVYPREEFVTQLKEFKLTGDLLPMTVNLGWVAPSGLMRYRSAALGKEYTDNFFCAQFNTHKVSRHVITRDGAGFRGTNEDFLVSSNPDFHATDVLEDADGSMLVVDTGGWFRIGCPTSQVAKPEILGGIYRIRRKDTPKVEDPHGLKLAWDKMTAQDLSSCLDDPRWAIRDKAMEQLANPQMTALETLGKQVCNGTSVASRRNAVMTLLRLVEKAPRLHLLSAEYFVQALSDPDAGVRLVAAQAAGRRRLPKAREQIQTLLADANAAVRRQAGLSLSQYRSAGTNGVSSLLAALARPGDRFTEHALIYALIRRGDAEATRLGLADASPAVRRGALVALDQMDGGNVTQEEVLLQLDTDNLALQRTAWQIITARPEWAPAVIGQLRDWLHRTELSAQRREMLKTGLLAFAKDAAVQQLVVDSLNSDKTATATRVLVLEALPLMPLDKLPPAWVKELGTCLRRPDEGVIRQAITVVRARNVADHDRELLELAADTKRPPELRVAALGAVAARLPQLDPSLFDFLRSRLDKDQPPLARLAAAEALGSSPLSDTQLEFLAQDIAQAAALELPHLVAPFERSKNPQVGHKLLAALDKAPGLASLPPENLRRTIKAYPAEIQQEAVSLLKRLDVDTDAMKAKLTELEPVLTGGDGKRGRAVFFGKKAACSACHTVGTEGGKIGPDLSKIAGIRTGRDLLEAVVFPSSSLVRGFEPYVVVTAEGRQFSGIIGRETTDAVFLVNAERNETRIPRSAVETLERSKVSIMPQGLDGQLTRQELADLLAYLQTLR